MDGLTDTVTDPGFLTALAKSFLMVGTAPISGAKVWRKGLLQLMHALAC